MFLEFEQHISLILSFLFVCCFQSASIIIIIVENLLVIHTSCHVTRCKIPHEYSKHHTRTGFLLLELIIVYDCFISSKDNVSNKTTAHLHHHIQTEKRKWGSSPVSEGGSESQEEPLEEDSPYYNWGHMWLFTVDSHCCKKSAFYFNWDRERTREGCKGNETVIIPSIGEQRSKKCSLNTSSSCL